MGSVIRDDEPGAESHPIYILEVARLVGGHVAIPIPKSSATIITLASNFRCFLDRLKASEQSQSGKFLHGPAAGPVASILASRT